MGDSSGREVIRHKVEGALCELTSYVKKYFMLDMIVDGEELHDSEEN